MVLVAARRVLGAVLLAGVLVALGAGLVAQSQPLTLLGTLDPNETFVGFDESIAAGPGSVIITSNDSVSIRRKSGELITTAPLFDMFRTLYTRGETSAFDPRVHFDQSSGRFFVLATGYFCPSNPSTCPSHYFLAVSKTSAPASLGALDWFFSAYDATLDNATPTARWADFPGLGISDDAVVITAQTAPFGEAATVANKVLRIRVLSKQPLLAGQTPPWVDFSGITDPASGGPIRAALQPAIHFGGPGTSFVLGLSESGCNNYVVIGIQNAATAPTLTSRSISSNLPCDLYQTAAAQPGGSPIVSFSGLRASPVYRNGSLWVARGVGKTMASGATSAIRLSQIDVGRWPNTPSMLQDAVFAEDGAGRHYPTLTVDASNNVAMIFGRSSATEYLSLYATGRLGSDPPNTLRPPVLFKSGNGSLTGSVDPSLGGIRFADYFGAALDPFDGTVWLVGEYGRASAPAGLGRWIGHLAFPPDPSTPPSLSLRLNATAYATRDTMTLTATMTPGARSTGVDAYVVVLTPDGQSFSLRLDGSIVPGVVPIATGFAPFPFTGDLARIAFVSAIPAGRYTWQTYFTEPGTTTVVGVVNDASFTFTP